MSLAIIPDDLRQHFSDIGADRFLSDLPVGYEVTVTKNAEDLAWIFTTKNGHSKIYQAAIWFYRGMGQTYEIEITMRNMGGAEDLRVWSSWEGHIKG